VSALAAALTFAPTGASAHSDAIDDPNDTAGALDIRSAGVRHLHSGRVVVHHVQTFGDWSVGTLGDDSFFVILIDNAGTKRSFERCAFAFRSRRGLRGALTNCRGNYITGLGVDKVGADAVDIKIDAKLGSSYRWAAQTVFAASSGACRSSCVDAAPNVFPLPLHDVTAPETHVVAPTLSSDVGTTSGVEVSYSASDSGGAGLASWVLRRQVQDGVAGWEDLEVGSGPVSSSVQIDDLEEGTTTAVRMVATDGQENIGTSTGYVAAPWDDASSSVTAGYSGSWTTASPPAGSYGGTLHVASAENATFELSMIVPADHRIEVVWVAPGTGTWEGTITATWPWSPESATVDASSVPDLPRQRAADLHLSPSTSDGLLQVEISVPSGGGAVPLDALAVVLTKR
jgi:hypothetical protein